MPHILDVKMPVRMGNCIKVANYEKEIVGGRPTEADEFICIQVENETGKEEYAILMTQKEFDDLPKAYMPDMDNMVFGRIYPKHIQNTNYYGVKMQNSKGEVFVGLFKIGEWSMYYRRAIEHPKSVTVKNLVRDILD